MKYGRVLNTKEACEIRESQWAYSLLSLTAGLVAKSSYLFKIVNNSLNFCASRLRPSKCCAFFLFQQIKIKKKKLLAIQLESYKTKEDEVIIVHQFKESDPFFFTVPFQHLIGLNEKLKLRWCLLFFVFFFFLCWKASITVYISYI